MVRIPIRFPQKFLCKVIFLSIVYDISKAFYVPINHIKGFWTKVEQYCATLPLCRETPVITSEIKVVRTSKHSCGFTDYVKI